MPSVAYPAWKHRARVDITNATTTANYQHRLNLSWLPGMATDFRDIRFSTLDGTPLYYWEESSSRVTGTSAVVWIKITTASTKTIYLYYENGAATDASDGTNTFVLFDDFLGAALNTALWDSFGPGSVTVGSSLVVIVGGGGGTATEIKTKANFDQNYKMRMRFKNNNANSPSGWGWQGSGATSSHWERFGYMWPGSKYPVAEVQITTITAGGSISEDYAFHIYEIDRNAGNAIHLIDGVDKSVGSHTQDPTSDLNVTLDTYTVSSAQTITGDWVFIAKDVITEPTLAIGTHGPNPHFSALAAAGMWIAAIVAATAGAPATYIPNIMHHRRNQGMS